MVHLIIGPADGIPTRADLRNDYIVRIIAGINKTDGAHAGEPVDRFGSLVRRIAVGDHHIGKPGLDNHSRTSSLDA